MISRVINSLSLQDTPATVRILQGHAGLTVGLQVAGLDRNLCDLQTDEIIFFVNRVYK